MTTIVYKEGVIAYDSRATAGGTIVDDDAMKLHQKDGVSFFFTGMPAHAEEMIEAYFKQDDSKPFDNSAIVVDGENIYQYGINKDDGFYRHPIGKDKVFSIGSGSDHAYTAMDMGCSAVEAVEMAIKRDIYTGGKVRSFLVER